MGSPSGLTDQRTAIPPYLLGLSVCEKSQDPVSTERGRSIVRAGSQEIDLSVTGPNRAKRSFRSDLLAMSAGSPLCRFPLTRASLRWLGRAVHRSAAEVLPRRSSTTNVCLSKTRSAVVFAFAYRGPPTLHDASPGQGSSRSLDSRAGAESASVWALRRR